MAAELDVLNAALARADQHTTLWGVYLSVTVAALTLVNSEAARNASAKLRYAVAAIFAAFAVSSAFVIHATDTQRAQLLEKVHPQWSTVAKAAEPASPWLTLGAHVALDVLVLSFILRLPHSWWSPPTKRWGDA